MVVHFEERDDRDIKLAQRLAFFASSDVLMITPTRYTEIEIEMSFFMLVVLVSAFTSKYAWNLVF